MLGFRKVALTGGLSCGKSSVIRTLQELGARAVSADAIVHQLLISDKGIAQSIVDLLGTSVLVNGVIDRKRVAKLVFSDSALLDSLEAILHPSVYQIIGEEADKEAQCVGPRRLFVAEIPLLFESGGEKGFDDVITVVAPPTVCLQRFLQNGEGELEDFERRSSRQLPLLEKARLADYVIMNCRGLPYLKEIVIELYQELNLLPN